MLLIYESTEDGIVPFNQFGSGLMIQIELQVQIASSQVDICADFQNGAIRGQEVKVYRQRSVGNHPG
jgi:hypothetical protein